MKNSPPGNDIREVRPFFIIVGLVLLFLYITTVSSSTHLQAPLALSAFTLLTLIHGALYWQIGRFIASTRQQVVYLVSQGLLALSLILLGDNYVLIIGLTPPLIGLASGTLPGFWPKVIGILGYLGMAILALFLTSNGPDLLAWAWTALPITLFVIVYVVLYTRQVEAKARVQNLLTELESAHQQLAEYATQVEDLTLAAERQRMARELHDTLTQGVAGLILQLEAIKAHLAQARNDRAQEIVQQALHRARQTLAEARQAIGDLRQATTSGLALSEALEQAVERFTQATGIPCQLELGQIDPLPEARGEHVSRIVAEGLNNIARHAQASQVWLSLNQSDEQIILSLKDDGCGFDPIQTAKQAGHYGLLGMRERARLADGSLSLDSAPGRGTQLGVSLSLRNETEAK